MFSPNFDFSLHFAYGADVVPSVEDTVHPFAESYAQKLVTG